MPDAGYANPFMGPDGSGGGLYGGVPGAGGGGLYGGGYGGLDPLAAGLLAAAQAFAQAGQASRTPQSSLGAFGESAGAFGQGYGTAAAGQRQAAFQGAQMQALAAQAKKTGIESRTLELGLPAAAATGAAYNRALQNMQQGTPPPAPSAAGAPPAGGGIPFGQGPVSSAVPDMAPSADPDAALMADARSGDFSGPQLDQKYGPA